METQDILNLETGEKEAQALKPKSVKIVNVRIEPVESLKRDKAVFEVKHPDREETIDISSAKYERNKKLQITGLWVSLDEDGKLQKGSALAHLKDFLEAKTLKDTIGKEIMTAEDDKGYLCFRAY